jgi:hypothetical protein
MELMRPSRRAFSVKAHEVNCEPWSEWMIVEDDKGLESLALFMASITRADSQRRSMAQPTTLRLKRSRTTQQ